MVEFCNIAKRQDIITFTLDDSDRIYIEADEVCCYLIYQFLMGQFILISCDISLDSMGEEHTGATSGVKDAFIQSDLPSTVFNGEVHEPFNGVVFAHKMAKVFRYQTLVCLFKYITD